MSRMNELSQALDEIRSVGEKLITISDLLRTCFSAKDTEAPAPVAAAEKAMPVAETEQPEAPQLTFMDVRRVLSAKSREGRTAEVKALIAKYGADKLSDLSPENYAALVAEAEVL